MGARVVFHAVNGGRDGGEWSREVYWHFHETNLRIRAAAGRLWIVTVDNCSPTTMPCSAPSGVVDPQGQWVCRTEAQGEQFFVHTIVY
jgi:predicted amidohydrolase